MLVSFVPVATWVRLDILGSDRTFQNEYHSVFVYNLGVKFID